MPKPCSWLLVNLALAAMLLAGCGGTTKPYVPPLEGMITWEDGTAPQDLESGTIEFESGGKTVAQTGVRPDGTFILAEALPAGTYRVRILPPPPELKKPAVLNPRYQSFEQSGLTYSASDSGPQQANFKLTKRR